MTNHPPRTECGDTDIFWSPTAELRDECAVRRLMRELESKGYGKFETFIELHTWAVHYPERFWPEAMRFLDIQGEGELDPLWCKEPGPTPLARRWFPEYRLNFAENLLRSPNDSSAIVAWSEDRGPRSMSRSQLRQEVMSVANYLTSLGVQPGQRVFGFLPNIPEAIVCMLGAAAIGATWSSCGTDYQLEGLRSRIRRVDPQVLVCVSRYLWRGNEVDTTAIVRDLVTVTPSIRHGILIDYLGEADVSPLRAANSSVVWETFHSCARCGGEEPVLTRFPFSHPLYIMFSSGTTGTPKGIVHGAGGTLLEHKKEHSLHSDIRRGDKVFYQTSTSWMMWNWLVSALSSDATVVLYDGDPLVEDGMILWRMAEEERVTHFGTSAAFLAAIEKKGVQPGKKFPLLSLRAIFSTGSTLYPSQFDYVQKAIKPLWLQSISGGTDIIGCFGLGCPLREVVRGEVQAKSLGYDVCVFSREGTRVIGEEGELICANSVPSMPLYFLDDSAGEAYRAAYFNDYPTVWRHGDYLEETTQGGLLFLGRSDATLKPGGVRVATADVYSALYPVAEVQQALAVGYQPAGSHSEKIVLFVVLESGCELDDKLQRTIRDTLRRSNTFYVPALILQAPELPRTTNNKLAELSVKRVLKGEDPGNASALANPTSLDFFKGSGGAKVREILG